MPLTGAGTVWYNKKALNRTRGEAVRGMVRTEKTVRTETADGERCRKGLPDAGACSERCNAAWRRLMRYRGT